MTINEWVLLWMIASLAGVIASLFSANEARKDLDVFRDEINGRKILAKSHLRRESVRIIVHTSFFLIGIPYLGTPSRGSLLVVVLLLGNIGFIANTILDLRTRYKLYGYYWRRKGGGNGTSISG